MMEIWVLEDRISIIRNLLRHAEILFPCASLQLLYKLMIQTSEQVESDHIIIGVIVLTLQDNVTKLDTHTNCYSHLTPGPGLPLDTNFVTLF